MTYRAFASAMKTSTRRGRGPLPLFRDKSIEQQQRCRAKEAAEQKMWNERWLKGNRATGEQA
jgi:hypothetical protein